jgi:hypothetical protein
VEEEPGETTPPIVISFVDLFEHSIDLVEDVNEEFLPVGLEHWTDNIINRDAGIINEKAVFDFVLRLVDDVNCFLNIGERILEVSDHFF